MLSGQVTCIRSHPEGPFSDTGHSLSLRLIHSPVTRDEPTQLAATLLLSTQMLPDAESTPEKQEIYQLAISLRRLLFLAS